MLLVCGATLARAEEPWSVEPAQPVIASPRPVAAGRPWRLPPRVRPVGSSNPLTLVALAVIWVYQHGVSPVDGATCGFYPSCSGYGVEAVRKHGWLLGSTMAMERIMRNHAADGVYPWIRSDGLLRLYDPLEHNDFWFSDPAPSAPGGSRAAP